MSENKNLLFKVSTSIIKFAFKIVYFGSFLVWKLFFRRNIPTNWSVKLSGSIWKSYYRMSGNFLPIFTGLRRLQVLSKCDFLKVLLNLPVGERSAEWLSDFETPASNNNMQNSPSHNNSRQSFSHWIMKLIKSGLVSRTLWHVTGKRFLTTQYSKLGLLHVLINWNGSNFE